MGWSGPLETRNCGIHGPSALLVQPPSPTQVKDEGSEFRVCKYLFEQILMQQAESGACKPSGLPCSVSHVCWGTPIQH